MVIYNSRQHLACSLWGLPSCIGQWYALHDCWCWWKQRFQIGDLADPPSISTVRCKRKRGKEDQLTYLLERLDGPNTRRAKPRWTSCRWLSCGSTLLRAEPTASPCSSASSATSYLSAIQLYTATSLTISRRRMGVKRIPSLN
ncbi:uncharacterized protein LOC124704026 isoform X4 [Lolium rigidum]|uniref:uncharacterized protein LOC124704026 isoform X4 n=1 Tax=Lolium rigidum TaxID=89674 RepID=UPI001F5C81E1|nr:uncharacterized protein LOC124704026 isoform X4 [Lolium rigidum]